MKTSLVNFTSEPGICSGFLYLLRGTLVSALLIFMTYMLCASVGDAYQLDQDGEIGIGQVQATTQRTTRGRRGRISIRYELDVRTSHGMLSLSSDSRIPPGDDVRYIYSPSSEVAQLAPEPLQRGDMLWANLRSFGAIYLIILLSCGYYGFTQYVATYAVVSGRYTVNGKRVGATNVQRPIA